MTVLLKSIFLPHCRQKPLFSVGRPIDFILRRLVSERRMDSPSLAKANAAPLAVFIVLLLLGPTALAKPKPQVTLDFVYYVSEGKEQAEAAARVVNYTAQRAWLATHEDAFESFPKEFRRDLNGDGHPEAFLRVLEHAHFAGYNIFTQRGKKWIYLGGCDYGGERLVRLARTRAGWHDFYTEIGGSRDSLERRYFRFDPKDQSYDLSYIIMIRPMTPVEP